MHNGLTKIVPKGICPINKSWFGEKYNVFLFLQKVCFVSSVGCFLIDFFYNCGQIICFGEFLKCYDVT